MDLIMEMTSNFIPMKEKKYKLKMDVPYLSCKNGEVDYLNIRLTDNRDIIINVEIEIMYGFVEFKSDAGVGDACDQNISYKTNEIVEHLELMAKELEEFIKEEEEKVEKLINEFNI